MHKYLIIVEDQQYVEAGHSLESIQGRFTDYNDAFDFALHQKTMTNTVNIYELKGTVELKPQLELK